MLDFPSTPESFAGAVSFGFGVAPRTPPVVVVAGVVVVEGVVLAVAGVVVLVSVVVEVVTAQSSLPGFPSWPEPPGDPLGHRGWGVGTVVVVCLVVVSSGVVSSVVVCCTQSPP
jgi:hypothetical protein